MSLECSSRSHDLQLCRKTYSRCEVQRQRTLCPRSFVLPASRWDCCCLTIVMMAVINHYSSRCQKVDDVVCHMTTGCRSHNASSIKLWTRKTYLYSMRCAIGSQCSWYRTWVTWSRGSRPATVPRGWKPDKDSVTVVKSRQHESRPQSCSDVTAKLLSYRTQTTQVIEVRLRHQWDVLAHRQLGIEPHLKVTKNYCRFDGALVDGNNPGVWWQLIKLTEMWVGTHMRWKWLTCLLARFCQINSHRQLSSVAPPLL